MSVPHGCIRLLHSVFKASQLCIHWACQMQGLVSFCVDMARNEGIASFYKGFIPNFARIGSFNIVLWLTYEKIRHLTEPAV